MKKCVVLLNVVLVVVFVEAVLSNVQGGDPGSKTLEGGASPGFAERVCPPETRDGFMVPIFNRVEAFSRSCVQELDLFEVINKNNATTEELHKIFDGICQKKLRFRECLLERGHHLEACTDTMILKLHKVMSEFLERKFESVCDQNAELAVKIFSGKPTQDRKQVDKCFYSFSTIMHGIEYIELDISSWLFILHKRTIAFKECFSTIEVDTPQREAFDYLIDETITTMQCIHPQDSSLVTCASLDPALVNFTNICDVKTQHNTLNLYDALEEYALLWFEHIIAQDKHDAGEEDITNDNEKLREDFEYFCRDIPVVTNHLEEVIFLYKHCSNESDIHSFNLLVDNIGSAVEYACTDDGKRLSDIMFEVFRLKRTSPDHGHAVRRCIEAVQLTRRDSDEYRSSYKNMRDYRELETFKECFINTIRGDETTVDAATSLIDGILGMMKCVNPEDDSTVLCASLMRSH